MTNHDRTTGIVARAVVLGTGCASLSMGTSATAAPAGATRAPNSTATTIRPASIPQRHAILNPQSRVAIERGRQLEAAGSAELAKEQFRRAALQSPGAPIAWQVLGRSLSRHGHWVEAAAAWREVLHLASLGAGVSARDKTEAAREFEAARAHLSSFWVAPDVVALGANSDNPTATRPSPRIVAQATLPPRLDSRSLASTPQTDAVTPRNPRRVSMTARPVVRNKAKANNRIGGAKPLRQQVRIVESPRVLRRASRRSTLGLAQWRWAARPLVTLGANSDNPVSTSRPTDAQIAARPSWAPQSTAPAASEPRSGDYRVAAAVRPPAAAADAPQAARMRWTFSFYLHSFEVALPSHRTAMRGARKRGS